MSGSSPLYALLVWVTTIAAVLLAALCLYWGVHSLLHPFAPTRGPISSALASSVLLLTGVLLVYALVRPRVGGLALCLWAVAFGWMLYSFRLTNLGTSFRALP